MEVADPPRARVGDGRAKREAPPPALLFELYADDEGEEDAGDDFGPGVEVFGMGTPAGSKAGEAFIGTPTGPSAQGQRGGLRAGTPTLPSAQARQHFIGTPTGPRAGRGGMLVKEEDDVRSSLRGLKERSDAGWRAKGDRVAASESRCLAAASACSPRPPGGPAEASAYSPRPVGGLNEVDDASLLLDVQFEAAAISALEPFAASKAMQSPPRCPRRAWSGSPQCREAPLGSCDPSSDSEDASQRKSNALVGTSTTASSPSSARSGSVERCPSSTSWASPGRLEPRAASLDREDEPPLLVVDIGFLEGLDADGEIEL